MGSVLANGLVLLLLAAAMGAAGFYLYKERKKGRHCIGCPMSDSCQKSKCPAGEK